MKNNLYWLIGFALLLGISRIIPHPPNFTPILAVAIFIPFFLVNKWYAALPITLGAMLIGDLYWGLHEWLFWTYGSVALCSFIASYSKNLMTNSVLAPVTFFIVTNFGVWTGGWYGYTLEGLFACYVAAIPFFHMTLLGTIFYTAIFYGLYYITKKYGKSLQKTV